MTEKRFETNMRLVIDTEKKYGRRVLNAEEVVNLLNEQDQQIKELENKITKIEEIIDNRLDNKVIPKWENNNELFIEEKVGYRYALRQLKKKLIREKICFKDRNIEDME